MSRLEFKDDSNIQHSHDDKDNEFSGIGKQSIANSNNFIAHTSKNNEVKLSQQNLVNINNNSNMINDQNEVNELGFGQNSCIREVGDQSQQKDSKISQNQNSQFLQNSIALTSKKPLVKQSSKITLENDQDLKINKTHSDIIEENQNSKVKKQSNLLSQQQSKSFSLIQSKGRVESQNNKQIKGAKELYDQNNNFSTGGNIMPAVDSLQYSTQQNPQSQNFRKQPNNDQNQRLDTVPTPLNSLQEELISNEKNGFIHEKVSYNRYERDSQTLILPELKEVSNHFVSNDRVLQKEDIQSQKNEQNLKKVSQKQQNLNNEIQEQIKRSRKISDDHCGFHQSENFEIEKQYQNRKRVETEFNERQNDKQTPQKFFNLKIKQNEQEPGVFQTQIFPSNVSLANSKLSKIKLAKEYRKKKLEEELAKISQEIDSLSKKQAQIKQFGPSYKNFSDRLKINNNTQARQKAISLVKNLQRQRKAREFHKISSIDKIDVRISDYMSQLSKIRTQNENRLKEKKKLEIIERMKEKQVKKINQIKKIQASSKFVSQFMNNLERKPNKQNVMSPNDVHEVISLGEQRKKTKLENYDDGMTPELANKKAYLNRIRNLSQKKHKFEHGNQKLDPYESKLY